MCDNSHNAPMNQMPSEILLKILSYLDITQLFKTRLVAPKWNEFASLLLQEKSLDTKILTTTIWFDEESQHYVCTCGRSKKKKRIEDFIHYFSPQEQSSEISTATTNAVINPSRPFPFSRFHFEDLDHFPERREMFEFISLFGWRIKFLELEIKEDDDMDRVQEFWQLLGQHSPNIQHLAFERGGRWLDRLQLFNIPKDLHRQGSCQDVYSFARNIKTLRLPSEYREYPKFIENILENCPLVQEVMPLESPHEWKEDDLKFWIELKKLHLVKRLKVRKVPGDNGSLQFSTFDLRLQLLNLQCNSALCIEARKENEEPMEGENVEGGKIKIKSFIDTIYKSSRDSLTGLTVTLKANESTEIFPGSYFRGEILPNVRHICLIFSLWNSLFDDDENVGVRTRRLVEQVGQLCPKASHLKIDSLLQNFPQVAPTIWTYFRGLKSLILKIQMQSSHNNVAALDSVFSGLSEESIQRIHNKLKEDNFSLEEAMQLEDQTVSILDLTKLTRLEIQFYTGNVPAPEIDVQLQSLLFIKMLPPHLKENPRSLQIFDASLRKYIPLLYPDFVL